MKALAIALVIGVLFFLIVPLFLADSLGADLEIPEAEGIQGLVSGWADQVNVELGNNPILKR